MTILSPTDSPIDPSERALANYITELADGAASAIPTVVSSDPALSARALRARNALAMLDRVVQSGGLHRPGESAANPACPTQISRFQIVRELGRGGMGIVYLAIDPALGRDVALKLLTPAAGLSGSIAERFRAEGRLLARLRHPSIVQVFETGEHDGLPFIAMEYVAGSNLHENLSGRRMPARAAAALVEGLATAAEYAHREGIVHRDLKPANIIIQSGQSQTGKSPDSAMQPKISDFGLATTLADSPLLTRTGELIGTPNYLAPELLNPNGRAASVLADVYGLGGILYECLTGQPPFSGDNVALTLIRVQTLEPVPPRQFDAEIPRDIQTICLKCLEKDPIRRYGSASALAEDLASFQRGEPIAARPVGTGEAFVKWARRNRVLAAVAFAGLAAMIAGTATSVFFAIVAGQRAERAAQSAHSALQSESQAREAQRESDALAARLKFLDAVRRAESGDVAAGMSEMIAALRLAPNDEKGADFRRVVCHNFSLWAGQLPLLRYVVQPWGESQREPWAHPIGTDGTTMVVWSRGRPFQLFDSTAGHPIGKPWEMPADEWPIAVSRAGDLVLTRVSDGSDKSGCALRIRRVQTGETVGATAHIPLLPERSSVPHQQSALLSPRAVMTGGFNTAPWGGPRRFWNLEDGTQFPLTVSDEHLASIRLMRAVDGRPIASAIHWAGGAPLTNAKLEFWDVASGQSLKTPVVLDGGDDPRVHANGRTLTTVFADETGRQTPSDGSVGWWDTGTGQLTEFWQPGRPAWFSTITSDGQSLISYGWDERLRLYDLDTGYQRGGDIALDERLVMYLSGGAYPGSPILHTYHPDGYLRAWDTRHLERQATAAARPRNRNGARRRFTVAAISPNGQYALFSEGDGGEYGRLAEVATGNPIGPPLRPQSYRSLVSFSADGKLVATASRNFWGGKVDNAVCVYETATGRLVADPVTVPSFIHGLAMSPDGRIVAVPRNSATSLIEVKTGRVLHELKERSCAASALFLPNGGPLVIGYRTGWPGLGAGARAWDATTGLALGNFQPFGGEMSIPSLFTVADSATALAFDPTSRNTWLFDAVVGSVRRGPDLPSRATAIAVRSGTSTVAVGYKNGTVSQWDLTAGVAVGPMMTQPVSVTGLNYSPDGRMRAVNYADSTIRIWDAPTGLPLGPPLVHSAEILAFQFTANGEELLTATAEGEVRRWPMRQPVADDATLMDIYLEVATGRGTSGFLDPVTWKERTEDFRRGSLGNEISLPLPSSTSPADDASWHIACVREAEATGNAFAAISHLSRLVQIRPTDWRTRMRLSDALRNQGDQNGAEAAEARKLAPSGAVDDWMAHSFTNYKP